MININFRQKILLAKKYKKTAWHTLTDNLFYFSRQKPVPFPHLINIFITERCNFACPMCHVKESRTDYQKKATNELTLSDLLPLIKEASKHGSAFQIIGGEPLLSSDIINLIKKLDEYNLPKGLTTNGLLLEKYASQLVDAGLDFLSISLDGYNEEIQYRRGHVVGSFDKAINGIKKVKEARGKKLLPNIRLATVVAPMNVENFERVLDVARNIPADQWSVSHYFYYFDKIKKAQEEFASKYKMGSEVWGDYTNEKSQFYNDREIKRIKEEYAKIIEKIENGELKNMAVSIQKDLDIEKYYKGFMPQKGSVCTSPFNQVFIRGNGDVEMCQGYILGNIKNESLGNIWNNKKSRYFRHVFNKVGRVMPSCFRCCAMSKFKF